MVFIEDQHINPDILLPQIYRCLLNTVLSYRLIIIDRNEKKILDYFLNCFLCCSEYVSTLSQMSPCVMCLNIFICLRFAVNACCQQLIFKCCFEGKKPSWINHKVTKFNRNNAWLHGTEILYEMLEVSDWGNISPTSDLASFRFWYISKRT